MRYAMVELGADPALGQPADPRRAGHRPLRHRRRVRHHATPSPSNVEIEYGRNAERYRFLKWGQQTLRDFAVVPPGTGIMHQVNVEYLARVVTAEEGWAFPDICLGTDSHTTMVNGLGVLAWGIGGIEAEAVMLGESLSMLLPRVVGFRLHGQLPEGATATDLVLTITEMLRRHGVVGKFVEFYGPGVAATTLPDRLTIANMSPEFGSTCAYFPIDDETLRYLRFTGRPERDRRPRRGLRQAPGPLARPGPRPAVLRARRARPRHRRALDWPAPADRRTASCSPTPNGPSAPRCPTSSASTRHDDGVQSKTDEASAESFPASDPPAIDQDTDVPEPGSDAPSRAAARTAPARQAGEAGRRRAGRRHAHDRPRQRRHRRDHLVHQHLQPVGDGRRRPAGQERRRARPAQQGVGQDQPVARARRWSPTTSTTPASPRTSRSSASTSPATAA